MQTGREAELPETAATGSITLPEAGLTSGYGDSFDTDPTTGSAGYRIELPLTQARAGTPEAMLSYRSGAGNSPFGIGFSLAVPQIARRTDLGVPRYDATDLIQLDGDTLVPACIRDASGAWQPDARIVTRQEHGATKSYLVRAYRREVDTVFDRIEWWQPEDGPGSFWQVTDAENRTHRFGTSRESRISNPADPDQEFAWNIVETVDAHGNRTLYRYRAENDVGLSDNPADRDRDQCANRYLTEIAYGNDTDGQGNARFGFRLVLDYGEYGLDAPTLPLVPSRDWSVRPDPFSTYRAGFEIRTWRRCGAVLMVHDFPDQIGASDCLVAALRLDYDEDPTGCRLRRAQRMGYRPDDRGGYRAMGLPEIELGYTPYDPARATSGTFSVPSGGPPIKGRLDGGLFRLIDLAGDGLPGVFYAQGETRWYWPPLGAARFGPARPLPDAPNALTPERPDIALVDLTGAGFLDLVVEQSQGSGFFGNRGANDWQPFETFATAPNTISHTERLDLTGDGRADLYAPQDSAVQFFPSRGRAGYGDPARSLPAQDFPLASRQDATTIIGFADLFGDGLPARFRLVSGALAAWPSLGHGRFGPPVVFDDVPQFGPELSTDRVLFGDLNGNGLPDLILVHSDHVTIHLNMSGNGFGAPTLVPLPAPVTETDTVFVADLFGYGGATLIVSRPEPAGGQYWLDVTAGQRPGLLNRIDNGTGADVSLSYRSSTDFALAAQAAGAPWVTRLPNPVTVVHKVIRSDHVTGARMVSVSEYRDGWFDPVERRFQGFGHVQSQDSETYGATGWLLADHEDEPPHEPQSTPALSRSWSILGDLGQQRALAAARRKREFNGDAEALALAPYHLAAEIANGDATLINQALRALSGSVIRREIYAVDDDGVAGTVPLSVEETELGLRLVQPPLNGQRAVFARIPRQGAKSFYEGKADDPHISQTLALEVDRFSQTRLQAVIAYGRRCLPNGAPPDQQETLATLTRNGVSNVTHPFRRIGIGYETEVFDVAGIAPASGRYLDFDTARAQMLSALTAIVPYGAPFEGGKPEARRAFWTRKFFWDDALTAPLPLSGVSARALPCRDLNAAFPEPMVARTYDTTVVTPEVLKTEGGYVLQPGTGYWWQPTETQIYYGEEQFWLIRKIVDPFGNETALGYDPRWQMIIRETDALGQVTSADLDYVSMQIRRVVDINDIVSEAAFDPLGMVVVTALHAPVAGGIYGTAPLSEYAPQAGAGFAAILDAPETYLQKAASFHAYDHWAWRRRGAPIAALTLTQTDWIYDAEGAALPPGPIQREISRVDGFGRPIGTCRAIEREAIAQSDLPPPAPGDGPLVWLTSNAQRYSDRGEPVRRYLPFVTAEPVHDPAPPSPCFLYYFDAAGRQIASLAPDGARTQTHYGAWSETFEDQNDCDPTSPDFGTGSTSYTNARGFAIQETRINRDTPDDPTYTMNTLIRVDLAGNPLQVADPRFYDPANPRHPRHLNFDAVFAMTGARMRLDSADAGRSVTLSNALGSVIESWDAKGIRTSTRYDALERESTQDVIATGQTTGRRVSQTTYGTDKAERTCGLPVRIRDRAGVTSVASCDLLGEPRQSDTQVLADVRHPVDWSRPGEVALLGTVWRQAWRSDALGAVRRHDMADGSRQEYDIYLTGWLRNQHLTPADTGPRKSIARALRYTASGHRHSITFGNGVSETRHYDRDTERLVSRVTSGPGAGAPVLQALDYRYDLVGNLLRESDTARAGPVVRSYSYDAVYRLRSARGAMQIGAALEPYTRRYHYDLAGNVTRLRQVANGAGFTRSYAVARTSNHVVPQEMVAGGLSPDEFYDPDGNLTALTQMSEPQLDQLRYDERGKLIRAAIVARDTDEPDAAWFQYGHDGTRTRKVVRRKTATGARLTDTIYVGGCIFERSYAEGQLPDRQLAELSVEAAGSLVLVTGTEQLLDPQGQPHPDPRATRSWRYQATSIVESVVLETGPTGAVVSYTEYFPFGEVAISDGKTVEIATKRYRYAGKERDAATGLYMMGQRYFAAFLCRWMTPDPSGAVDRLNLYTYADNNPTTKFDNTGRDPLTEAEKAALILQINQQYRFLTPAEAVAFRELAQDIKQEVHAKSTRYADENAKFTPALEQKIVDAFGKFSGMFMFHNPVLATIWNEAKSRLTAPTLAGDTRHDYGLVRSHMNNVVAEWMPDADWSRGDLFRAFETHHLEYKAKHPALATETYNMVLATRGSSGRELVGTHEGLLHMLTAGNMGNIYTTEVSAVTGIIKRLTAQSIGVDLSDASDLSTNGVAWLELEDRTKGKLVPIWSVQKKKQMVASHKRKVDRDALFKTPLNTGILSKPVVLTYQASAKKAKTSKKAPKALKSFHL